MLAWRSNPLVYEDLYTQGYLREGPLVWSKHLAWWNSRYNWRIWIIQVEESDYTRSVGVVSVSQLDSWAPQIGFYVGEITLWGKGVGKEAVLHALKWLKQKKYSRVRTTVLQTNERSLKLLASLGFQRMREGRLGEMEVELFLNNLPEKVLTT